MHHQVGTQQRHSESISLFDVQAFRNVVFNTRFNHQLCVSTINLELIILADKMITLCKFGSLEA